eukprot:Pgem_evm1s15360
MRNKMVTLSISTLGLFVAVGLLIINVSETKNCSCVDFFNVSVYENDYNLNRLNYTDVAALNCTLLTCHFSDLVFTSIPAFAFD